MAAKTVITIAGGVPAALQQAPSFIKWLQSKAKGSDAIASLARKVELDSEWPSFTGGSLSYDEYIAYRSRIRTCAVFDVRSIDEFELAWELYSVETAV